MKNDPKKPASDQPPKKAKKASKTEILTIAEAVYGSPDHPLKIGEIEIPCYVLGDGRRVITMTGLVHALGMSKGTAGGSGNRLMSFVSTKGISSVASEELVDAIRNPFLFKVPKGDALAHGYEATILADLCDVVLKARSEDKLQYQQHDIAQRCELLVRGFARVGIIALVDEATGYQHIRARNALEQILEAFIAKELVKWAKRFPDEFYEHMFRLRGWNYKKIASQPPKRPSVVGKYTNDLVYSRIAPFVLDELRTKNPVDQVTKRRKHRHHQWLTTDIGHPKLDAHIDVVVTLMKLSKTWDEFYRMLQRTKPRLTQQLDLFAPQEEGVR